MVNEAQIGDNFNRAAENLLTYVMVAENNGTM